MSSPPAGPHDRRFIPSQINTFTLLRRLVAARELLPRTHLRRSCSSRGVCSWFLPPILTLKHVHVAALFFPCCLHAPSRNMCVWLERILSYYSYELYHERGRALPPGHKACKAPDSCSERNYKWQFNHKNPLHTFYTHTIQRRFCKSMSDCNTEQNFIQH